MMRSPRPPLMQGPLLYRVFATEPPSSGAEVSSGNLLPFSSAPCAWSEAARLRRAEKVATMAGVPTKGHLLRISQEDEPSSSLGVGAVSKSADTGGILPTGDGDEEDRSSSVSGALDSVR